MTNLTKNLVLIAGGLLAVSIASQPLRAQQTSADVTGRVCCQTPAPLTAGEAQWLGFMREEEKLARDVYSQLFAKWKLRIFDNIGRSEVRHFEAVGVLLARYGVADPSAGLPAGAYADAGLNTLYASLAAKGLTSINDALEVGLAIEKKDIADLEAALRDTTRTDVKLVYTNLIAASLNHLEAFEQTLEITPAGR